MAILLSCFISTQLGQGCAPRVVEVSVPGGLPVGPLARGAEGGEHCPVPHQPQVQTGHVELLVLAPQEGELGLGHIDSVS